MAGQADDLVIEDTGVGQQPQEPSGVTLGRPETWLVRRMSCVLMPPWSLHPPPYELRRDASLLPSPRVLTALLMWLSLCVMSVW